TNTEWFWSLFPSVAHWMFAGAAVDVLVPKGAASARELNRRDLLKRMGARVIEIDVLPFQAYLLSRTDDNHDAAFVLNPSEARHAPMGTVYLGLKHRPVISSLLGLVDRHIGAPSGARPVLALRPADSGKLISQLTAGVAQYSGRGVTVQARTIDLEA